MLDKFINTVNVLKPHVERQIKKLAVAVDDLKPHADKHLESMKPHIARFIDNASEAFGNAEKAGRCTVKRTKAFLDDHKEEIDTTAKMAKEATSGAVNSVFQSISDTANFKGNKVRLDKLKSRVEQQSEEYSKIISIPGRRMVDSLFVGGDLLSDILSTGASSEVQAAYAAAFPDQAQHISFEDALRSQPDEYINGMVSAVKGKLFEHEYVQYLNDGNLPDGYTAELAHLVTQPGWDIAIHGPDSHIAEVLQLKATDSVAYVQHALERYPGIDVVTTDEVYSHLLMNGASNHSADIIESHISNANLTDNVLDSIENSVYHMHWTPPVISLAMIAFTTYTLKDVNAYEKASHFGTRSGKAYLTYLIGGGVMAITQAWWLGLIAGVGSRYLAGQGSKRREMCEELEDVVAMNDEVLRKLRARLTTQVNQGGAR